MNGQNDKSTKNNKFIPEFLKSPIPDKVCLGKDLGQEFFGKLIIDNIVTSPDNKIKFDIIGITPYCANLLRRTLISHLPSIAVDRIEFVSNESSQNEEFISHRLSMCPIKQKLLVGNDPDEEIPLSVTAIENRWITLGEILKNQVPEEYHSIRVCYLQKGKKLELNVFLSEGRGHQHAKWSISNASYIISKNVVSFSVESNCDIPVTELLTTAAHMLSNLTDKFLGISEISKDLSCETELLREAGTPGTTYPAEKLPSSLLAPK